MRPTCSDDDDLVLVGLRGGAIKSSANNPLTLEGEPSECWEHHSGYS